MKAAWPSPASDSALPCPKRWSSSAGWSDQWTASRLTSEAPTSISESINEAMTLTESVISQAASLATISRVAVATEA